jgi:glycosyltransferase involved in cell wall biosynthesis
VYLVETDLGCNHSVYTCNLIILFSNLRNLYGQLDMSTHSKNMPLVTVIIPTYNLAHYIVETLDSILMQTYTNMEIIIIDDGSQDHTDEVLAPYMTKITYAYQENLGISRTYNRAIEMAQGEYICFLEADDYWITKDKVEKQVALFQDNPSIDYILTGWEEVTPTGDQILNTVKIWEKAPELTTHDWFLWMPIRLQCLMIKKNCLLSIGGFDAKYKYAMDVDLFLKIVINGFQSEWLREVTTAYRIHPVSASHRKRIEQADEAIAISEHYINLESHPPEIRNARKLYLFFQYRRRDYVSRSRHIIYVERSQ